MAFRYCTLFRAYLGLFLLFLVEGVESKIKNKSYFKALYFEKSNDQFFS